MHPIQTADDEAKPRYVFSFNGSAILFKVFSTHCELELQIAWVKGGILQQIQSLHHTSCTLNTTDVRNLAELEFGLIGGTNDNYIIPKSNLHPYVVWN